MILFMCLPKADEEKAKIWIKITDIPVKKTNFETAMFKVRSTDANLKQVISICSFTFYVYLQEN